MPPLPPDAPHLRYDRGTLLWEAEPDVPTPPGFVADGRVGHPRAPGIAYRATVEWLLAQQISYRDEARAWKPLATLKHLAPRDPRPYQQEAVEAWQDAGKRGVVVLPTGTGKTYVAELCLMAAKRPTLIVVPTIDLLAQWHRRLSTTLDCPVGILGGGSHDVQVVTVSTYASAYLHAERYGDRFGLVIFDEVHHLPSESHQQIAEAMLAPFRLGLSATPERADEAHLLLEPLVGPEVYRKDIHELSGEFLADYETVRLYVDLSRAEQQAYDTAQATWRGFARANKINLAGRDGWQRFLQVASRSSAGRAAHKAWREARRIAHGTERKLDLLDDLLHEEAERRALIFTDDNATAYRIAREMLVPCITHQTPAAERSAILTGLGTGTYRAVVTSRVLNEGVDLPEVDMAVVVSGTGSVREHVQRLGRILRPLQGKQAVLYELVTAGTAEERTSARRREHEAYEG
ncbi:MAG: DEAD/DEAH box helicase family protein [Pseudomonadota bacterium]